MTQAEAVTNPVLLLVDDDPFILNALCRILRHLDVTLICQKSAIEALAYVENGDNIVSLIISDYCMPEMNGTDFLTRCKALRPETPTALLTAQLVNETEKERPGATAFVDLYLTKPWDTEELLELVAAKVGVALPE